MISIYFVNKICLLCQNQVTADIFLLKRTYLFIVKEVFDFNIDINLHFH